MHIPLSMKFASKWTPKIRLFFLIPNAGHLQTQEKGIKMGGLMPVHTPWQTHPEHLELALLGSKVALGDWIAGGSAGC